jgi:hypothetical protein
MSKNMTGVIFISICNMLILLITPVLSIPSYSTPSDESREQVTLVAILEDQGDPYLRAMLTAPRH